MTPAPAQITLARQAFKPRPVVLSADAFAARFAPDPTGFLAFCALLEIKPKDATTTTGRIPFVLTPIQRAYCSQRTPRDVILKPRQVKITSVELARDVWFWLTKPGVAVRVICQSSTDHSMLNELSERVGVILAALRKNAGLVLTFASETRTAWVLPNGASLKIVEAGASQAAAEKKERGATLHRVHTTELAVWEYAGATLGGMLESVAAPEAGTEIVHESTPNGMGAEERGDLASADGSAYFYWLCADAKAGRGAYKFHFFSWLQEPEYALALAPGETVEPATDRERQCRALGATPEQIKWYRRKVQDKGQANIDQEYALDPETCFLVSGRPFFDRGVTAALMAAACDPVTVEQVRRDGAVGTLSTWLQPTPGAAYVVAVDTSEGTGGDAGSAQVYERGTGRHCATLWGQFKPGELAAEAERIGYRYAAATIAVERNNHGAAVLQELQRAGLTVPAGTADVAAWVASLSPSVLAAATKKRYPAIFHDLDGKPGWNNVEVRRVAALDALEAAHRSGQWAPRDRAILGEVRTFVVTASGKAEGAKGAHDDLVMTAMVGWDVLRRVTQATTAPCPRPSLNSADVPLGM